MATGNVFDDNTTRDIISIVRQWRTGKLSSLNADDLDALAYQQPLPFVSNASGAIVPPYACMQITSTIEIGKQNYLVVNKPADTTGAAGAFIFNGHREIEIGGEGLAQLGPVFRGYKNTGTVTGGDKWIPVVGQWYIAQSSSGQFICCGADDVATNVLKVKDTSGSSSTKLFLTPGGGIAARSGTTVSSATCTEYKLVSGTLTTNTATQTVYNPWPVAIPASYYITATKEAITGVWVAEFPGVVNVNWNDPNLRQSWDGTNYSNIDTAENCDNGTGDALADGDYGDITVSGTGTVMTIDNDAVTNAKAANMADGTIKGRALGAGTGDPTDLTAAQARLVLRKAIYALSFATTQNWDLANGLIQTVTATNNFTLQIPTAAAAGETAYIYVTQDGTGSRVISFASGFKAPGGIASIILSTSAGSVDRLEMFFLSASEIHVNISKAFS